MTLSPPQRRRATKILWFGWLAFSAAITFRPFLWHVDYFKSPGPQFYTLAVWLLPVLVIACAGYTSVRRHSLWRYEPVILAVIWIAALLFYEPRATFIGLAIFVWSYAAGQFLLRRLRLELRDVPGSILFASALGLGALICILFVLGLFHLYYAAVFTALLAVPILCLHADVTRLFRDLAAIFKQWANTRQLRHPFVGVTMVFAAILLICTTMVALAPSLAFDVLKAHLVAVRYYAAQHALQPVPALDYSFFPQAIELLMTLGFTLGGQPAAQIIPPLFFALFILFCIRLARECGASPPAAVAGAICAAAVPFLHWTGSVAKNDLGLAFFELAALSCYVEWQKNRNFRWIQLGVFFVAMSFGVKHVALFGAVPIAILYLNAAWNQERKIRAAVSLLAIFCVFGLFWQVRTYLFTGNPVYPERVLRSLPAAASHHNRSAASTAMRYVTLPWQVHFEGAGAFESPSANPLGIFLVIFIPAWFLARRVCSREPRPGYSVPPKSPALSMNAHERACILFAGIYLVYWSTVLDTLRYAILPIAILFLLTAVRLYRFYEMSPKLVRGSILGAMMYSFAFAMCVMMIAEINAPQLALFAGKLDKPGYLRQALVTYPALEFLQNHVEKGDGIFAVESCSAAYAPDPVQFRCELCAMGNCTAAGVANEIAKGHYSYLILPDKPVYNPIAETLRSDRPFDDGRFAVYRLTHAP